MRVHSNFCLKEIHNDAHINVLSRATDNSAEGDGSFEAVKGNGVDFTCDFPLSYSPPSAGYLPNGCRRDQQEIEYAVEVTYEDGTVFKIE